MIQKHKTIFGTSHLSGRRPTLDDEFNTLGEMHSEINTHYALFTLQENYNPFLNYNPNHPNIIRFFTKWGYEYLR